MRNFALLLIPLLAISAAAQATDDAKKKLATMEGAAKTADALFEAASFAQSSGLTTDWRRLITRALAADANHAKANAAIGNVQYDGRWMSPIKAEILANTAKGLVSVDGVWVPEAEADDARAGIFRFEGEAVTRAEFMALRAGNRRHPRTGELIAAEDMEKARNGLFPADGKWVDEAEANRYHARVATPWVVQTRHCTVVGNMPLADIEAQAKQYVDEAFTFAAGAFGTRLTPAQRPVVLFVDTPERFRDVGNQIGGGASAYGGFLADGALNLPGLGAKQPAVALLDANWGAYYVKHAVGAAVAHAAGRGALPAWMTSGLGAYTERFYSAEIANWFGKQYLAAGGFLDLKGWFSTFGISSDMEYATIGQHLYQAGLIIAFCRHGGDDAARKHLEAVGEAMTAGDVTAIRASVEALETFLQTRADALRGYVKTLTQG